MPAQIETFTWCIQNEYFSMEIPSGSSDEVYTVSYLSSNPGPYAMNWDCQCKGFKYRKTCKHVVAAAEEKCEHGWEAAAGSPSHDWVDGRCPECGSKAIGVRVAV